MGQGTLRLSRVRGITIAEWRAPRRRAWLSVALALTIASSTALSFIHALPRFNAGHALGLGYLVLLSLVTGLISIYQLLQRTFLTFDHEYVEVVAKLPTPWPTQSVRVADLEGFDLAPLTSTPQLCALTRNGGEIRLTGPLPLADAVALRNLLERQCLAR